MPDESMVAEGLQRGITAEFEAQLMESGILYPILNRVKHDHTLSLEIRNNYIDIYYRGGRLLGLHPRAKATKFLTQFDDEYFGDKEEYPSKRPATAPNDTIECTADAEAWVDAFAHHKQAMDIRFSKHTKIEREYQQAVVRDNNRHVSGDQSDYMVVDIEYAQSPHAFPDQTADYRFDMVGFRWPVKGRGSNLVTPVIMEMKAGDGALASHPDSKTGKQTPGLSKHVLDIERFLAPEPDGRVSERYRLMCTELKRIYHTKHRIDLGAIPRRMERWDTVAIDLTARPEVLFVIANHQPSSTVLRRQLETLPPRERADYYVASVKYAGYALFRDNLKTVEETLADLG